MDEETDKNFRDILEKDILVLLGGEKLEQAQKDELYKKMLKTIQNRVIVRVDNSLSDEEKQDWADAVKSGDNQKITEFYERKGIDIEQMMAEEAIKYKAELVAYDKYQRGANDVMDEIKD